MIFASPGFGTSSFEVSHSHASAQLKLDTPPLASLDETLAHSIRYVYSFRSRYSSLLNPQSQDTARSPATMVSIMPAQQLLCCGSRQITPHHDWQINPRRRPEMHQDRVVIGRSIGICAVQIGWVIVFVVKRPWLIRIDVPDSGVRHLRSESGIPKRMVQIA